jgi:3'(2'), 5'-bisphosphate nucleotidase
MFYERAKETAIAAVTDSCRLCEAVRSEFGPADAVVKADRSPVTVADFGVQCQVTLALRDAFPDLPLVAEEDADELRGEARAVVRAAVLNHVQRIVPRAREEEVLSALSHGRYAGGAEGTFWTLDPIDGTKGFLRGGQYAIAIALIVDGEAVLGVLGCPSYPQDNSDPDGPCGCLFVAVKGQGARMRILGETAERAVHVSEVEDPSRAVVCESVEAAHSSHSQARQIAARLGIASPPMRIDSQCKYAAVARGDADIYLRLPTRADYVEKLWDHAAGCLLVQEAGGKVSDITGRSLDFSKGSTLSANTGVLATNGRLHGGVLAAVHDILSES